MALIFALGLHVKIPPKYPLKKENFLSTISKLEPEYISISINLYTR